MESIFGMSPEMELPSYLQALMQYFGSSYICLWSHLPYPHSNLLVFSGGFYRPPEQYNYDDHDQQQQQQPLASSSSSSSSRSPPWANGHFQDYTRSTFTPTNDRVPGHALITNHPYVELNESELLRMATILPQRLFYQEAKIKTAVFMGCRSGEIELGWSNLTANQLLMSIESEMMKLFPDDFSSRQLIITTTDQAAASSIPTTSTSSVRSSVLSLQNSPDHEYSSFLLNLTTTNFPAFQPPPPPPYMTGLMPSSSSQAMMEDTAMTRAFLAVFTTSTTTTSYNTPNYHPSASANQMGRGRSPAAHQAQLPRRTTAFKRFSSSGTISGTGSSSSDSVRVGGQSMFKRAMTYYRMRMRSSRRDQHMNILASRPTSTQLHHMISERRRREKINDSFQSLRSLLPPDAKKDKASVLSRTKEYMSSLIAQVAQLAEKNRHLESKLHELLNNSGSGRGPLKIREAATAPDKAVDVRLRAVEETTSEQGRVVELQVTVRGDQSSSSVVSDIVIRVLEFLRQVNSNVDLIALEASAAADQTPRFSRAVFRLQIQGDEEWGEAAFQEAVTRLVADLAQ